MNYKFILFIILIFHVACVNQQIDTQTKSPVSENFFLTKGFTLIYTDDLYEKKLIKDKIGNRSLIIFQKNLKKNSNVKITNLINSKYIIAKVGKKIDYPFFYNSVISQRIGKILEIDESEPYIEIKEIIEGSSFVAKRAKTFEEEKKVATKVPIDDIQIKDLSNNPKNIIKNNKKKFSYIIKIGDFYFKESANQMKLRILNETKVKKVHINKLSNTKFRVFLGPYNNLNYLKNSFNAINILQFDNIEIIKK
jgi:hypothetical protein